MQTYEAKQAPAWLRERVVKIAREYEADTNPTLGQKAPPPQKKNLAEIILQLEFKAVTVLKGELIALPSLLELVNKDFLHALGMTASGSTLSPMERAAVVVLEHDARLMTAKIHDLDELLTLKWLTLAEMLEAQGGKV